MKAALSQDQLHRALERVLSGEKIAHVAADMGTERSALNHRLRRRFPDEYAKAAASGIISNKASKSTYEDNARKKAKKLGSDPAVLDYLRSGEAYKTVAGRHGLTASVLYGRVQKVLKLQKERAETLLPRP